MSSKSEIDGNIGIDPKVARINRFDVLSNAKRKTEKAFSLIYYAILMQWLSNHSLCAALKYMTTAWWLPD